MAGKGKKTAGTSGTKITRITASTSTKTKKPDTKQASAPKAKVAKASTPATSPESKKKPGIARPFVAIGRYFKGAWYELKQVRWPTRRATWGLTGAMLVFTAFFVVLILLLDALFKYLFELMLG